jgi:WD40 repeat protein
MTSFAHTATWDASTGRPAVFVREPGLESAIAYAPDGAQIATGSLGGTIRTWNTSGQQAGRLPAHRGTITAATVFGAITALAYSPDGTQIAAASATGGVGIWAVGTGGLTTSFPGHEDYVRGIAYSPDGTRIATACHDGTAGFRDASTGRVLAILTGHAGSVAAVAFAPDGSLLVTASGDGTARIWDLEDVNRARGHGLRRRRSTPSVAGSSPLRGHWGEVSAAAFHPGGERVFTTSHDGTIRIWRPAGGPAQDVVAGDHGPLTGIAFSPDGKLFVTSSLDGTARLWSAETLGTLATFIPLPEDGYATLLPDGSYKLQGSPGDRLWWAMKLCRFGPGELDPYVPGIRRLADDAPILPGLPGAGS